MFSGQQSDEDRLQHADPRRNMHDHPGNTAHQQHAQHEEVIHVFTHQQPDNRPHRHPVSTGHGHLQHRELPRGQYQFLPFDRHMTAFRKRAGPEINGDNQQQHDAQYAQGGFVDIPVRGQLYHADSKYHPAKQNIAQPVGGDAQGKNARNRPARQPQARVQAIAHANPPDPGAQRQVKGVADKRHQHDLTFGQLVAAVSPTKQVIAAIHQIAHDNQPKRPQQHHPVIVADNFPHLFPVNFLRVDHQQNRDGDEKQPGQDLFCQPPARM